MVFICILLIANDLLMIRTEEGDQEGEKRRGHGKAMGNETYHIMLCPCMNIPQLILLVYTTVM